MKRRLYHPLWTHAPAVALIGVILFAIGRAWPLPQSIPVHFDFAGRPDRWGSPWDALAMFVLLPAMLLAIFVVVDEFWARQEKRKRFNWLSLIDEAQIAFLAGIALSFFPPLARGENNLDMNWPLILSLVAGAVLLAWWLERLRPHRPHPADDAAPAAQPVDAQLVERIRSGGRWSYWESQNPRWLVAALVIGAVLDLALAIAFVRSQPWVAAACGLVALVLLAGAGGMRVSVTPRRLAIMFGLIPVPILTIRLNELSDAQVTEFSPLVDFGGWGIRWNGRVWAYVLRGTRGVKLQTARGKHYVIGSDHADRLATVLRTAMGRAQ